MDKIMTQDEFTSYLKRKAKALEMDYTEMLERRAYLKYQAECLAKEKSCMGCEKQSEDCHGKTKEGENENQRSM